ncbi:D-ribitol-5-phosphate cytidylyltransferase isoform X3 [Ranitomeya variabilis]|uniref:D-ribitol-5-phosphate cytidylyltransferase isoform X3 n=1 Tax=Ranitomeya variabilis TaxID=490064 RepID=UPI0040560922
MSLRRPSPSHCTPAAGWESGSGSAVIGWRRPAHSRDRRMEGPRRVAAVLPAGGCGERLGGCTPKQYCPVLGRPLISRTLEALESYGHKRVTLVEGGVTRHRSIFNGLRAFIEDHSLGSALQKPEVVIIHDAVRPFLDEETLTQVTTAARQYGAAGAVRPLVSTVIAPSADGCLDHSLDRAKHRASEMPQAFLFDVIYKAYLQCSDYDLDFGTECLHLALTYSKTRAKLLDGPPDLWKVTYKRDLYAAESIIKDRISNHLCIITDMKEEAVQIGFRLHENLKSNIKNVKSISSSMCKTVQDIQNLLRGQCYNFISINVKDSDLEESRKLIDLLQAARVGAYYQSVVVSVHLALPEHCGNEMQKLSELRKLGKETQKSDILLYGLLVNFSKLLQELCCQSLRTLVFPLGGSKSEESQLEDVARQASAIITALITDRNPALIGQVMVA